MNKKTGLAFVLALSSFFATAQTTYLQLGQEDYQLLDRLETRSGHLTNKFFTTVKPVSRRGLVLFLEDMQANADTLGLTSLDQYNIKHAISVNGEWASNGDGAIASKHPWLHTFYVKQPDLVHVKTGNFFMSANPVISGQVISEQGNDNSPLFASSRGVEVRGRISDKVGFYTYLADNQEQPVSYVKNWTDMHQAVPGADYYQTGSDAIATNKTYDYLLARGYIDFAAVKDHINVTLGYDKHFIGDGMRSLFLSDFSAGATFLRLNTRIWKLNYQNLYLELTPQFARGVDKELPHKYATIHHLSLNATKWLNIGVFESVIFGRTDHYEFGYMVPVIFYRAIERSEGSPDNENLGFNFKAIVAKHLQFYGQFFLDELKTGEIFSGHGWWGNKFGVQMGGKYYDAFTVKNLDLQAEINVVRPYTYSHSDTIANYTNYNQPLAHPLGSGFAEIIGVARYQPIKKLYLSLKGMYYRQGVDALGTNFGNNIFLDNNTRTQVNPATPDFGYKLINGEKITTKLINLNASYELRENLFIDLGLTHRSQTYDSPQLTGYDGSYFYFGVRLNIARRDYDYF